MNATDFNPDRLVKFDTLPRRARRQHHEPKIVKPRRIEVWDGCTCTGVEVSACAYCRRKHGKDEMPW